MSVETHSESYELFTKLHNSVSMQTRYESHEVLRKNEKLVRMRTFCKLQKISINAGYCL